MKRVEAICAELKDERIVPIQYEECSSLTKIRELDQCLILRKDVTYRNGRTMDVMKIDRFKWMRATVCDIATTGSVVIKYKGSYTTVETRWSEEQRVYFLEHPDEVIGKSIEISYLNEADGKLQYPIIK
jgi:hypothetical protein